MSILKLAPSCKNYIWSGNKLKKEYGKCICQLKIDPNIILKMAHYFLLVSQDTVSSYL
jgi:hypothetical protein